jgi:hypothetical protein
VLGGTTVKQLIELSGQHLSIRAIARRLDISRNTGGSTYGPLRYQWHAAGEVDTLPRQAEDLPLPHAGVKRDGDDGVQVRVLGQPAGRRQPRGLVTPEVAEPAIRLPPHLDVRHVAAEAPLLGEPQEAPQDAQVPVDRGRRDGPLELPVNSVAWFRS